MVCARVAYNSIGGAFCQITLKPSSEMKKVKFKYTKRKKIITYVDVEETIESDGTITGHVAACLFAARCNAKMTQVELAKKIGKSRVSVVNIEAGRQNMSIKLLHKVCQALNLKSTDLLPF